MDELRSRFRCKVLFLVQPASALTGSLCCPPPAAEVVFCAYPYPALFYSSNASAWDSIRIGDVFTTVPSPGAPDGNYSLVTGCAPAHEPPCPLTRLGAASAPPARAVGPSP